MSKTIIDGVDVSECNYIMPPNKQSPIKPMLYAKESHCFACKEHNTKLNFCKNNPNCYYKQLQKLKQKCEYIKQKAELHKSYSLFAKVCLDTLNEKD